MSRHGRRRQPRRSGTIEAVRELPDLDAPPAEAETPPGSLTPEAQAQLHEALRQGIEGPSFTPAAGPQPPAARPYAPPAGEAPRAFIFEQVAGVLGWPAVLPCTRCGAVHADEAAPAVDRMMSRMRRTAHDAGWDCDDYGRWCCPACLAPRDLPVLAGGLEAEVDLRVRTMIAAGRYEDVAGLLIEIDGREARIRTAQDAATQLEIIALALKERAA